MKRWLRPPFSLRSLLVGQFLTAASVGVVCIAIMIIFWRLPLAREQMREGQTRLADLSLQQLENSLAGTEAVIRALAPLIEGQDKRNRGLKDALLRQLAGNGELYDGIYGLDREARIRSIGLAGGLESLEREWLGNDLSGLEVIEQVRTTGQLAWSDQYLSPVQGKPVVAVVLPSPNGFVLAEVSVARLAELALKTGRFDGLLLLVVDRKGELVAAPDMRAAQNRINIRHLPLVQAALAGEAFSAPFEYDGASYYGTAMRSTRLGWGIVLAYPKDVAQATGTIAIWLTVISTLLAAIAGLLTAHLLARWIGTRVEQTIAHARAISAGQYATPDHTSGVAELEQLDENLDRMALTISRREQQLRAITELTPNVAIQIFDAEGRVLEWNPASTTIFGWSSEEARGKKLDELIYTPEQQQAFLDVLKEISRTGKPFGPYEGEVARRDGSRCVLLSTTFAIPDMDGGSRYVCMDIDVTENREQEVALRESEQKFVTFFNASPTAISVRQKVGDRYVFVDVNPAWVRLVGRSRADVLDRDSAELGLYANLQDFSDLLLRVTSDSVATLNDISFVRGDGSTFIAEGSAALVPMGQEELIIASIHDVTDKRKMERDLRELNVELESRIARRTASLTQANQELQETLLALQRTQDRLIQTEKLASLGSLVAGIAHELNTPIGNGLMAATALQEHQKHFEKRFAAGLRRTDLEDHMVQLRQGLNIAALNLERAASLIRNFKQVSVDQASEQRRRFHLLEVVRSYLITLQPMIKRTSPEISVSIDREMQLDSYPGALGQVVINLVQNALVHGLDGMSKGVIEILASRVNDELVLKIVDNGRGIPADTHKRIFDPFYTTKLGQGGSGLGLSVVRNIVTGILGGQIDFQSQVSVGTTFTVVIPLTAPLAPPSS